jgi:hypothetical protein
MTVSTNAPVHRRATWRRPDVYSATVADPPRRPRLVVLRTSCGHALGIGLVWRRQRYLVWKRCTRP